MTVDEALRQRISIRAFKPDPVPQELVREVLEVARWSPSGGNVQPWSVIAVAGAERDAVVQLAQATLAANPRGETGDYPIYPADLSADQKARRVELAEEMYRILGIAREDKFGRLGHMARNYQFFGAPVGLFFVIDRTMGHGQWAHMGMFMQSIALAAEVRGLGTCMQEAWAMVRASLGAHFGLGEGQVLYCGMALGWPDREAPVNALRSTRVEVDGFTTWRGF
jgi:nitroreductase